MKEDFLYFIWKFQLFDHRDLQTICGKPVTIKKTGFQNNNAGPDFSEAHLVIDHLEWYGNVEMHLNSSDWFEHKHQYDSAYDSVILHIVWHYNTPITDSKAREVPTISLESLVDKKYIANYQILNQSLNNIPCHANLTQLPAIYFQNELEQQLVNRLERKTFPWKTQNSGELKTSFYELVCQSFGFKVNSQPFLQISKQLPLSILLKHREQPLQIEALLFGVAGMLSLSFKDDYPKKLWKEWQYLKHKYQLAEMTYTHWKFAKMRPQNFPTTRLAQLTQLIIHFQDYFDAINSNKPLRFITPFFQHKISSYWQNHYVFDKESKPSIKLMGKASFYSVVINAIIPFIYLKFKKSSDQKVFDYLQNLLSSLPAEQNHKTEEFSNLGITISSAYESQALTELLDYKCLLKKCLSCKMGNHLMRKELS